MKAAAGRINGLIRPVTVSQVEPGAFGPGNIWLAHEFMQYTGTFKARGAANFTAEQVASGRMPDAGVVIASGGNAALACAWAAGRYGIPATVFVPATAPPVKLARIRAYGADVRLEGREYVQALAASREHARRTGAVESHAYDHPLIAAGAGTLLTELLAAIPDLDTVVVAVGGGGLFAGVAAAADHHGVHVVAVEPINCRALNAAIEAGVPVEVSVDSIAADSLGAHRASAMALDWAQRLKADSVLVEDEEIAEVRQVLWDQRRIVVELGAAAPLAALVSGAYAPQPEESIAVVLCGANTDPADLTR